MRLNSKKLWEKEVMVSRNIAVTYHECYSRWIWRLYVLTCNIPAIESVCAARIQAVKGIMSNSYENGVCCTRYFSHSRQATGLEMNAL